MNFALVGLGYISKKHIDAIKSVGGKVILTCDIDESKGADFLDFNEMINSEDFGMVDIVSILTPNFLHADMVEKIAKKGKVVICEKPLVITVKDVERLKNYKNVFVVLQLRHHPLVEEMRKAIKEENKVKIDVGVWRDKSYNEGWKGNEKKSGGIYFNLGIHYIDLAGWLVGNNKMDLEVELTTKSKSPHRIIEINGKKFDLSNKENLAEENLHRFVYQDLIKGIGVEPKELVKLTKIIYERTRTTRIY